MEKILAKLETYIVYALVFLVPIFVLSISPNPFIVSKVVIITFGVALLVLIRAVRIIVTGRVELSVSAYDLPVAIIVFGYLLSTFLVTPNKMEAWLLPGTTTIVVGSALIYFILNQQSEADKKTSSLILLLSGAVFTLVAILTYSELLSGVSALPTFLRSKGFTPEGGYLPAAMFFATLLPLGIGYIISEKKAALKVIAGVSLVIVSIGLLLSFYNLIPGKPYAPKFPGTSTSWNIAIDALKSSPIMGVGSGNYLSAFNRFRPVAYNATELWSIKYATASNFYMTLLTETGLLGLAGVIILLFSLYKNTRTELKEKKLVSWGFAGISNLVSLVLLLVLFVFFPATTLGIFLFFIYFSYNARVKKTSLNLVSTGTESTGTSQISSKIPALIISIPIIVVVLFVSYRAGRIFYAEYKFNQAIKYLVVNDAANSYQSFSQAITINPNVDRYRTSFARLNLALANSLAQNIAKSGKEANEEDRARISTLIQRAILEGKAAVALNAFRSGNWELLAQVYRSVMPLAEGADQFALQTYARAIALDPLNPNLRIALGSIYYGMGDYETAIKIFELAVLAKPDHPNAHYNLAIALKESGDTSRAISELTAVLSLIDRNSPDYEVARKALEALQEKKESESLTGTELTTPQDAQVPVLDPPLELPDDTVPPESPISPTPNPGAGVENQEVSVTPELTPTPTP